jgi:hypothetical protein
VERLRHRWAYNIKMDVRETDSEDVFWTEVIQVKIQWWDIANMVKNFEVS